MRRIIAITITVLGVAAACSSGTGSEQSLSRRAGGERPPIAMSGDPVPTLPPATTTTVAAPPPPPPPEVRLAGFESCDDALDHIRTEAGRLVTPWGLQGGAVEEMVAMPTAGRAEAGGDASAGAGSAPASAAPDAFSGTNLQEAGVDEPDLVKTDGRILLAVAQGRLHRVDIGPDGPVRHTEIVLPGGFPAELLLAGSRAVVFGHPDGPTATEREASSPYPGGQTAVWVVDLAGGGGEVVASMRVDGGYVSARAVGGIARVVLSSPLRTPVFAHPEDGSPEAQQRALAHNRWAVATSTIDQWLPRYELSVTGASGAGTTESGPLCSCDQLLHPTEFSGLGTLTVLTIDPADPRPDAATSVVAAGETVYASAQRLYVATGRWQVAGDVAVGGGTVATAVHSFDITDPRRATYLASGTVPGWAVNQWAMSEHDGHLRVATTVGSGTGDPSQSMVTVLAEQGEVLVPVGQVAGLGPGERIFAVRYMGATGYVVTFRQTDPLYVLDLSDPAAPRVLGELKIPGFSSYLHPVAPGRLLGVGQDATDEGRALGVQASLFDVTDPAAPARVAQWSEGRPSHSPVEWDHRAFLHWAPTGFAVVPVEAWGEPSPEPGPEGDAIAEGHRHAVVLRVDADAASITEAGRLTHDGRPSSGGWSAVMRSVVIGDLLYTVSDAGLLASDLASLTDRLWLAF